MISVTSAKNRLTSLHAINIIVIASHLQQEGQRVIDAERRFREYLSEKGLRFTSERLAILLHVMSLHEHFEVDDLHHQLRQKGLSISHATVFRTLALLIDSGIVQKIPCQKMPARYEHVFGHDHHDHMLCLRCGRIIEFHNAPIERSQEKVAKEHGFQMTGHHLIMRGYCENCH